MNIFYGRNILFPLSFIFIVCFVSCKTGSVEEKISSASSEISFHSDLLRMKYANPYDDLDKAIKENDLRFIGVGGVTVSIPVTDGYEEYIKKFGYRFIEGTSDRIYNNYEHGKLQVIANYYANIYNDNLLRYIKKMESRNMAVGLSGYKNIHGKFDIEETYLGYEKLSVRLKCISEHMTESCTWINPIINGKAKYNWDDFLYDYKKIADRISKYSLPEKWKKSKKGGNISLTFYIRSDDITDVTPYILSVWQQNRFKGEICCELTFQINSSADAVMYFSENDKKALIRILYPDYHKFYTWLDEIKTAYETVEGKPEFFIITPVK